MISLQVRSIHDLKELNSRHESALRERDLRVANLEQQLAQLSLTLQQQRQRENSASKSVGAQYAQQGALGLQSQPTASGPELARTLVTQLRDALVRPNCGLAEREASLRALQSLSLLTQDRLASPELQSAANATQSADLASLQLRVEEKVKQLKLPMNLKSVFQHLKDLNELERAIFYILDRCAVSPRSSEREE